MSKLYVPVYENGNCAYIYNSDIVRVYSSTPRQNSTISYTDYYIKSSYISNTGNTTFSNYSILPTCITDSNITTNVMYRNDIADIMITFFILLLVCFYFPYRIISRLFGRWLKW